MPSKKTSRPTKWKKVDGVGCRMGGGAERREAYDGINSLQKLEFNLRGAREYRDKKVALQRSYHSVSSTHSRPIIMALCDNALQAPSTSKPLLTACLCPADTPYTCQDRQAAGALRPTGVHSQAETVLGIFDFVRCCINQTDKTLSHTGSKFSAVATVTKAKNL